MTDPKVTPPAEEAPPLPTAPEPSFKLASGGAAGRLYGVGQDAYRSDDGGESLGQFDGLSRAHVYWARVWPPRLPRRVIPTK